VLDGQLRLPVLTLDARCEIRALTKALLPNLPYPAEARQRYSRCWRRASFTNMIEQRPAVDKVYIAGEGHEAGGLWWSLGTFYAEERR
jgi:hypothetical protein